MSSRVRIMFQDFANSMAWTGRRAYDMLEVLYQNWAKAQGRPQKRSRLYLKKVLPNFALANPFLVQQLAFQPTDGTTIRWEGPGHYMSLTENYEEPPKTPPKLVSGPKWLRALEMWEQLSPTHSDRYRLFVARDNRKQAWRRSLCNPFFQNWGFKVRPAKTKKAKYIKASTGLPPAPRHRDFVADWVDRHPTQTPVATNAGYAPAVKTPKPKVGIWT